MDGQSIATIWTTCKRDWKCHCNASDFHYTTPNKLPKACWWWHWHKMQGVSSDRACFQIWYMHRCYPWIKLWLIFSTLLTFQTPLTCTNWSFAISSDSNGYEVSHDFKMSLNIFWLIGWLCKKRSTTQIAKLMGPTWVLPAPDGPDAGLMNLAIREDFSKFCDTFYIKPEV